jgi:hypothetical protein
MVLIVLLVIAAIILYFYFKAVMNINFVARQFDRNNMIVYGKKGTGKDMLFQQVINKRKQTHYSNINYGKTTLPIQMNQLSLYPNTFETLINNKIVKVQPNLVEKTDVYISDAGVMLPSQYDYLLHKKYPSLPLLYALQRHLYNSNLHANVQSLGRIWKPLRELADGYIKCEKVIWIGPMYIQLFTYYDRYESAERTLLPMKRRIINGMSDAITDQYIATNGIIKQMFTIGLKKNIHYNTRYFKTVFLNNPSGQSGTLVPVDLKSVVDNQDNTDSGDSITPRD